MKKRGRRWVWVAAVATIVAVATLALLFRERPPYDFLRDATYDSTVIETNPVRGDTAVVTYETKDIKTVQMRARDELVPKGWSDSGGWYLAHGASRSFVTFYRRTANSPGGIRYTVELQHPASVMDRFRVWLDRVTLR